MASIICNLAIFFFGLWGVHYIGLKEEREKYR